MAKKPPQTPLETTESVDDIAKSAFRQALILVRDEITGIRLGQIVPKKHTPTETVAFLAKQAGSFYAELRKADKAELASVKKLTPAVIMAWVKLQTPEYRARLVREVAAVDATERKSVLG